MGSPAVVVRLGADVDAVDFDVALFTNLSRDHLDYHGDMQAYGAAKARLFTFPSIKTVVLNADDAFSPELSASVAPQVVQLRYSLTDTDADSKQGQYRERAGQS